MASTDNPTSGSPATNSTPDYHHSDTLDLPPSPPSSSSQLPLRRKPLPAYASPPQPGPAHPSSPLSIDGDITQPTSISPHEHQSSPSSVYGDPYISVPRNSNRIWKTHHLPTSRFPRYSRGSVPAKPLRIDTRASTASAYLRSVVEDEDDDDDDSVDFFDESYEQQFTNGLATPPAQSFTSSMALHPPMNRPPPLHIDIDQRSMSMSMGHADPRQPKTPGKKISSFFGWKGNTNAPTATSPGGESSSTEISDGGRSSLYSPMPPLANVPIKPASPYDPKNAGFGPLQRTPSLGTVSGTEHVIASKINDLENELREISSELAGSIRREMELEDLVERFQLEGPEVNRRTSDYFSDSGTSSVRYAPDRSEDIEKIRRAAEQERAQLKVELSQKLQEERIQRTASESHVQILENQVQQLRRERTDLSDLSSKTHELEGALENTRRKLLEERQSKDNFEDLLTAMRVELEQLRNERDLLREGKAPPADMQRLIEEIEALKIENASLAQLQGGRFASIAEEDSGSAKRNSAFGLSRSNSLARKPSGLKRSGSLSRSNSVKAGGVERESGNGESLVDKVNDIEVQRDALHRTLKSLLDRQAFQAQEFEKRARLMEIEVQRAKQSGPPRKLGYEKEVRSLRDDLNHLRMRAEDALDGKWQCEKNLAGLKMDLDRAEQDTGYLRSLLLEHDAVVSEGLEADGESFAEVMATSSSLEAAYQQLQLERQQAGAGPESDDLTEAFARTDSLNEQVQYQLQTNSSLRSRLESAILKGERDQQLSVERINVLQSRMKELEDVLLYAQQYSEEAMGKHEDEIRLMKENQNAQLVRMKNGSRTPVAFSPRPQNAPFTSRTPRLDQTTSGTGMPLTEIIQAEALEKHIKGLERLLREADMEMEEAVGRMNHAQVDVAQLQSDRDEALRQTRQLQADIQAERDSFKALAGYV
ncbi:hypothetical protein N7533_010678 [Penicillium manginii]|uniref:uncharacterized protein n=1 Tax=Penicillium manginii TaxID=203109 RepID=UPI002547C59D|nr:uncharacterized protein N7533_010678 [Penicillium manginii]KAJ5741269.1 hypothetical protein N7533_010678 [Penicillium manginii]